MTAMMIILNLATSLLAVGVLATAAGLALRLSPGSFDEEGRADWGGPPRRRLSRAVVQRTAASIATATNSSAR